MRRVLVTGLGVVSPYGSGRRAFWNGLAAGRCAIGPIRLFDTEGFRARIGAEIAATVEEQGLFDLHAPIRRVTGYDTITPLSRLEYDFIPSAARIADTVRATLAD